MLLKVAAIFLMRFFGAKKPPFLIRLVIQWWIISRGTPSSSIQTKNLKMPVKNIPTQHRLPKSLFFEIFEKYYPGQTEMVVDFWMPNKSWEGCDVNDPSARVLSNYSDIGK